MPEDATEAQPTIRSLERGLAILRMMQLADRPISHHEVVAGTGLAKATVSRLLFTLCATGHVRRLERGMYVLEDGSA
ncbi:helix-turn-helix domain-containing protein [Ramlibacter sp.]|uniref:helix-turn-helix domain-containing protein n=1 Tax=Ramlibacter sp. TaxID=1917967 RepID=UPI003D09EF7A